jgi:CheY-like chemotaxis protein
MTERILFVDDEPNVLDGIRRNLRKHVDIETAAGGADGLRALETAGPFAVVVSDMRMPNMSGVEFLARVRQQTPESVRMILTGNVDIDAAIAAVNEGHVFRFLTKPCGPEALWTAIEAGVAQYRLIRAEKELLEQTLSGAVKMLTDVLALANPTVFARAQRVERYMLALVQHLALPDSWELRLAAMLSQIGCVGLPQETLSKLYASEALGEDEQQLVAGHPAVAARLLSSIPRLDGVAAMLAAQHPIDPVGLPADPRQWDPRVLGGALLHIASEYERLVIGGRRPAQAAEQLRTTLRYPRLILDALRHLPSVEERMAIRMVHIRELTVGMVIDQDLVSATGVRMVASGQEVSRAMLERLRNLSAGVGLVEPFRVRVPA